MLILTETGQVRLFDGENFDTPRPFRPPWKIVAIDLKS